jgi:hypothetical protein
MAGAGRSQVGVPGSAAGEDALGGAKVERAVVTYLAPHGIDALTMCDGDVVLFGRGAECQIRFAYAPVPDEGVPRVAGSLLAANRRIFVESAARPGHRALELRTGTAAAVQLPVGEGRSPRDDQFDVFVHGTDAMWKLSVTVRAATGPLTSAATTDPPTRVHALALTDLQRAVLTAYSEPITRGRPEPATHKEVAAALNYHPNTVREVLYEIWALMFAEQIPMPDVSDKRVAVVEAARVHGMLHIDV